MKWKYFVPNLRKLEGKSASENFTDDRYINIHSPGKFFYTYAFVENFVPLNTNIYALFFFIYQMWEISVHLRFLFLIYRNWNVWQIWQSAMGLWIILNV